MGEFALVYLAKQIEQKKLNYKDVIDKYPDNKEDIDNILREDGMYHLIIEESK